MYESHLRQMVNDGFNFKNSPIRKWKDVQNISYGCFSLEAVIFVYIDTRSTQRQMWFTWTSALTERAWGDAVWSSDKTLGYFFQIPSYLFPHKEKTKGQIPQSPSLVKQNIQTLKVAIASVNCRHNFRIFEGDFFSVQVRKNRYSVLYNKATNFERARESRFLNVGDST